MEIVETLVRSDLHGELAYQPGATGTEVAIRLEDAAPDGRAWAEGG
jgi:hypothetical protein